MSASPPVKKIPRPLQIAFTGGLMCVVFYQDLKIPLGVAAAIPYVWVLLSSRWSPGWRATVALALVCTLLTWFGYLWSPLGGEMWMVVGNRLLTVFAIWVITLLCLVRQRTEAGLEAARLKLTENSRLMQAILDGIREGVFVADRDGRLLLANPAGRELLADFAATRALRPGEAIDGLLPGPMSRALRAAFAGERVDGREFERVPEGPDAPARHFSVNAVPLRDARDAVAGGILTVRDVSSRRSLEAAMVAAAEAEQRRIGRDLHDGLVQQLAGVSFLVQTLQARSRAADAALVESLGRIGGFLGQAAAHARRLSHTLYPVELQSHGLTIALEQLLDQVRAAYGLEAALVTRIVPPAALDRLGPEMEMHLYRIAQEGLANACRHAGATRVRASLEAAEDRIALAIEDDGRGLGDAGRAGAGIGMRSMTYRAHALGGGLTIGASELGGACIRCEAPLAERRAPAAAKTG
jgi:signal transduction histidine kinase